MASPKVNPPVPQGNLALGDAVTDDPLDRDYAYDCGCRAEVRRDRPAVVTRDPDCELWHPVEAIRRAFLNVEAGVGVR